MAAEQLGSLRLVTDLLDQLGVAWALGGSFASSLHGVARTTMDADVVADLGLGHVVPLATGLGDRFYMDVNTAAFAVRTRGSFNVIDRDTAFKIDLFVVGERPWDREALRRRQRVEIAPGAVANVTTAEDTVLAKLEWYRKGGEVSDRQWRDVQGILRVQRERLDRAYIARWAGPLGVWDLFLRAEREATP